MRGNGELIIGGERGDNIGGAKPKGEERGTASLPGNKHTMGYGDQDRTGEQERAGEQESAGQDEESGEA